MPCERTDLNRIVGFANFVSVRYSAQVDEVARLDQPKLHHRDQRLPTRKRTGVGAKFS
jgi:hypothetical protein